MGAVEQLNRWKPGASRQRAALWHWGAQVAAELTRCKVICPHHSCQSRHLIRDSGNGRERIFRGTEQERKPSSGVYVSEKPFPFFFVESQSWEDSTAVKKPSSKIVKLGYSVFGTLVQRWSGAAEATNMDLAQRLKVHEWEGWGGARGVEIRWRHEILTPG